jgi:predicted nucleic acid-binding protein
MNKVIISDASCLIALDEIGQIEILKSVFPQIVTTNEVSAEFGKELPTWISIKALQNSAKRNELELELVLDAGEASAIALALENPKQSILIIDEKKGRKIAKQYNLEIIGTLRVLLLAKQNGVIPSVKNLVAELTRKRFRFTNAVVNQILEEANES